MKCEVPGVKSRKTRMHNVHPRSHLLSSSRLAGIASWQAGVSSWLARVSSWLARGSEKAQGRRRESPWKV